jgi:hypothetical protein
VRRARPPEQLPPLLSMRSITFPGAARAAPAPPRASPEPPNPRATRVGAILRGAQSGRSAERTALWRPRVDKPLAPSHPPVGPCGLNPRSRDPGSAPNASTGDLRHRPASGGIQDQGLSTHPLRIRRRVHHDGRRWNVALRGLSGLGQGWSPPAVPKALLVAKGHHCSRAPFRKPCNHRLCAVDELSSSDFIRSTQPHTWRPRCQFRSPQCCCYGP